MDVKNQNQYTRIFKTELAIIGLRFDNNKLIGIDYLDSMKHVAAKNANSNESNVVKLADQIKEKILNFLDPEKNTKSINVDMQLNVTPFQKRVLKELLKIPYGQVRTYGNIAEILKTSPRAVGNACRNNPIPIIIPCHRIVAATGIGGYDGARSGKLLEIKRNLLAKEDVILSS